MATAKTDLEKAADEQSKLVADIEKLREQAADEERKLVEAQQLKSVQTDTAILEQEKARLKARLEAAKEATKAFAATQTPLEQAEAAAAEIAAAQSPVITDDEKKGE